MRRLTDHFTSIHLPKELADTWLGSDLPLMSRIENALPEFLEKTILPLSTETGRPLYQTAAGALLIYLIEQYADRLQLEAVHKQYFKEST